MGICIRPVNNRTTAATATPLHRFSTFLLSSAVFTFPVNSKMATAAQLAALRQETFWANRSEVNDAERDYYAAKSGAKVDNLAGMTGQANKQVTEDLKSLVLKLEGRVEKLEKGGGGATTNGTSSKPAAEEDDDDDVDLFGSDDDEEEESAEAKRVREERLAAYHAKKSKKPALIAKTP